MAGSSKVAIYAAIFGNMAIAITKFIAAAITGSSAMLAEGIHSVVDTGNGALLLVGIKRSQKPPDAVHPFGYGPELYFWTLIVAFLIFALGGGISILEGIEHLEHPQLPTNVGISYVVLILAMIFEGVAWAIAYREFNKMRGRRSIWQAIRRSKDPTTFAVLFEDTAAMLGLIIAFVGIFLGQQLQNPYLDGAASIAIGLVLCLTALLLLRETKALLLGESADPDVVEGIQQMAEAHPAVERSDQPLTMHLSARNILVNLNVQFRPDITAAQMEAAVDELEASIRKRFPAVRRIFVEAESLVARARSRRADGPPG